MNKIKAYKLQDNGYDTVEANHKLGFSSDMRDFSVAHQMLKALNIKKVKLMTNNPRKINSLREFGLEVSREEHKVIPCETNLHYLNTKKNKLEHML